MIRIYQYTLSPDKGLPSFWLKGRICSHEPHCSKYSISVLKRYGFWPGIFYASDRILHCTASMHKTYDPEHYRIVFFSSAPIGVPFLEGLTKDKRFEVVGVVTQCDKPSGRGMEMNENIIKKEAKKIFSSSSNSFSFREGELQKIVHEIYKKHHIYGESGGLQVQFARDMRKNPTIAEDIIRDILRNRKVLGMKRRRQFPINKYIADFYNEEYKIILEIDGGIHDTEEQKIIDKERNQTLEHLGYKVLRCKNEDVFDNLEKILTEIAHIKNNGENHPSLKERGKGGEEIFTPTKLHPEKSEEGKEFAERLKEKNPDFLVVIAYGKIIPQAILDIPKIAPINIHGSLLPKYRGASPIQSTVLNNDKETGLTIMKMDATMDTGDMIDILRFRIPFQWTTKELIEEMTEIGPKFLNDTLRKYGKKLLGEVKQKEDKATYCGKIEKESGLINPRTDTLETIYNKYRAFFLWPKIYFILNDKRVIIERLELNESTYNSNDELPLFNGKELHPAVLNIQLKPEGKKAMEWKEFLNGYLK
ncbi:MAG: membrane protein insertion efficiency factor YidD [candidate division SR1 bacterium]|nr:membrane protein insertion efficiency factor YidD [candidate division SR1 bacterium]